MRNLETLKTIVEGELFSDLDGRVEDLYWREDTDGNLFVADERRPTTVKQVELGADGLTVTDTNPHEAEWDRLTVVSEPETATVRQQD